jgi:hypothetical protein
LNLGQKYYKENIAKASNFDMVEFFEIIADIVDSLAWPGTFILAGWFFRKDIRKLLENVIRIKFFQVEIELRERFKEIVKVANVKLADGEIPQPENTTTDQLNTYKEKYKLWLQISEESPHAAIVAAWNQVENALSQATSRADKVKPLGGLYQSNLEKLISSGHVNSELRTIFKGLQEIRNQAAHAQGFVPDQESIRSYLGLARMLWLSFDNVAKD